MGCLSECDIEGSPFLAQLFVPLLVERRAGLAVTQILMNVGDAEKAKREVEWVWAESCWKSASVGKHVRTRNAFRLKS